MSRLYRVSVDIAGGEDSTACPQPLAMTCNELACPRLVSLTTSSTLATTGGAASKLEIAAHLQEQFDGAEVVVEMVQTSAIPVSDDGTICAGTSGIKAAASNGMGYSLGLNSGPPTYQYADGSSISLGCSGRRLQGGEGATHTMTFTVVATDDVSAAVQSDAFAAAFTENVVAAAVASSEPIDASFSLTVEASAVSYSTKMTVTITISSPPEESGATDARALAIQSQFADTSSSGVLSAMITAIDPTVQAVSIEAPTFVLAVLDPEVATSPSAAPGPAVELASIPHATGDGDDDDGYVLWIALGLGLPSLVLSVLGVVYILRRPTAAPSAGEGKDGAGDVEEQLAVLPKTVIRAQKVEGEARKTKTSKGSKSSKNAKSGKRENRDGEPTKKKKSPRAKVRTLAVSPPAPAGAASGRLRYFA